MPDSSHCTGAGTMPAPVHLQYDNPDSNTHRRKEILLEQHERLLDQFLADVQKRAWRMAEIATDNREDAFDIVQDAMSKFTEKYRSRQVHEWGALFHTVLQSRIRDWYRRETVRNRFRVWFGREDEQDLMENVADEKMRTPEQMLHNSQSMTVLDQAIRRLPLRQQQALMLRIFEGMDVEQTACVMGCSSGSVKTHYSRAVHTLREQLGEHWP